MNNRTDHLLTLVTAPGCHFCDEAEQAVTELMAGGAPLRLRTVEAASPEGRALLRTHRPAMNPLVLVDGAYFSAGRLPRRKLQGLLATITPTIEAADHG